MNVQGIGRIGWLIGFLFYFSPQVAFSADAAKGFRISAVQENQIWIEGGLLDGLERGMEGEIRYEIYIAGQKKRIVPAKVRLAKADDHDSIGTLYEQLGIINIGYNAYFTPRHPNDLLLLFNQRASESYAQRDFKLALQYYRRMLEALPGDAFAAQKIADCEARLENLNALQRERKSIPYYREVIRSSLASGDAASLNLAQSYIGKILSVEPDDSESLKLKEKLAEPALNLDSPAPEASAAKASSPAATPVMPAETAKTPEPKPALPIHSESPIQPESSSLIEGMIRIPEGDYSIGSPPGRSPFKNETPKHVVHLASYYLDAHEVTNEEYKKFCDATGHAYPNYFSGKEYPAGTARQPVVLVNWNDADEYARWKGKRLPTEFEWEVAAAGSTGKPWPWGQKWIPSEANTREKGENGTADVGSHPLDMSEFGIYDMAGNVSEWTQGWYEPYPGNSSGEKEYGEKFKVLRGGSNQASKEFSRAQFRARLPESFRSLDLGFRCAISAETVKN